MPGRPVRGRQCLAAHRLGRITSARAPLSRPPRPPLPPRVARLLLLQAPAVERATIVQAGDGPGGASQPAFCFPTSAPPAGKYTIFGQVIDGMEVLDRMEKVPTGPNDRPLQACWDAGVGQVELRVGGVLRGTRCVDLSFVDGTCGRVQVLLLARLCGTLRRPFWDPPTPHYYIHTHLCPITAGNQGQRGDNTCKSAGRVTPARSSELAAPCTSAA